MIPFRRLSAAVACAMLLAAAGCEEDAAAPDGDRVDVPSGREVVFLDVISNAPGAEGATARFRFVAPGLNAGEDWVDDMQALCDSYALPRVQGVVPEPQQIVISLADRALPFGESAPEAVQFFEAYALKDGACIWEVF